MKKFHWKKFTNGSGKTKSYFSFASKPLVQTRGSEKQFFQMLRIISRCPVNAANSQIQGKPKQ